MKKIFSLFFSEGVKERNLRKNEIESQASKPISISCPLCDKMFKTMGTMKKHVMTNHNSVPCKYCDEIISGCSDDSKIIEHYEKLHPNFERCPYCSIPNFPKSLKQHISQIHRE